MATVYVLTVGSYSDYRIVAIFDSLEKLVTYRDYVPDSDYNEPIETWELNPEQETIQQGLNYFAVQMHKDGSSECEIKMVKYVDANEEPKIYKHDDGLVLEMTVLAKNAEHAAKIVNEKRVQLIAQGLWEEQKSR